MENEHKSQSDSIGNNLSHKFNALVGKDYVWPGWNESRLGNAPKISIPALQSAESIAELNNILSNISKMANADENGKLNEQLKNLSGHSINIKDLNGNLDNSRGPIGVAYVRAKDGYVGNDPEVSFNPKAWGKYPVEGDSTKYGIASPEQMMIHELGHYIEIQNVANKLKSANEKSNIPVLAGAAEVKAYEHALDEQYIVNNYENPVMMSLDPSFEKRDANRYSDAVILFANKNGYPDIAETERATLMHAMKISQRELPREFNLSNQSKSSGNDQNNTSYINALAASKALDLHFQHLAENGISASNISALKTLTSNITERNVSNETLPDINLLTNFVSDHQHTA